MRVVPSLPSVKAPALAAAQQQPVPTAVPTAVRAAMRAAPSGSSSFGRIRKENEQDSRKKPVEAPRVWLVLAFVCSALVVASGFAPWLIFARDDGGTRAIQGVETDGILVTICGIVVCFSLGCVLWRDNKVLPATIAFGTACLCLLFIVANWMLIDMYTDTTISKLPPTAGWGIVLATGSSLLTVIAAYRVLRVVRVY